MVIGTPIRGRRPALASLTELSVLWQWVQAGLAGVQRHGSVTRTRGAHGVIAVAANAHHRRQAGVVARQ